MASEADEYRFYARQCLMWAEEVRADDLELLLRGMARAWRKIAMDIDGKTDFGKHPLLCLQDQPQAGANTADEERGA
jgi:hypothetical protein